AAVLDTILYRHDSDLGLVPILRVSFASRRSGVRFPLAPLILQVRAGFLRPNTYLVGRIFQQSPN
ncbi:hypothetical protein, partial [Nocardia sp. 852002-51244_SCH5132740]|uniref:hypothetical protein n=1 Tax=Nocardia sp. 852002-51244_SCH5132740 TaxID=1834099 RepID=UPI000AA9C35E